MCNAYRSEQAISPDLASVERRSRNSPRLIFGCAMFAAIIHGD